MANSVETRHGKAGAKHGEQRGDQTLKGGSDSQQSRDQTTGMGIEKSASGVLPPAENEFGLFWKPVVASQCTEIVRKKKIGLELKHQNQQFINFSITSTIL